jgi:hypothetical protein
LGRARLGNIFVSACARLENAKTGGSRKLPTICHVCRSIRESATLAETDRALGHGIALGSFREPPAFTFSRQARAKAKDINQTGTMKSGSPPKRSAARPHQLLLYSLHRRNGVDQTEAIALLIRVGRGTRGKSAVNGLARVSGHLGRKGCTVG